MLINDRIYMALGDTGNPCNLLLNQANRHGLIAGASGTGKTVTFKVMAEGFSAAGVPVFMADVKGDISGMAQPGVDNEGMQKRIDRFGIREYWEYRGCPVRFWDMLTGSGMPVRVTVSDMGPVLLARLLGLTDVQEGILNIVFRVADDQGLLLIDLKDLRALLNYVYEHSDDFETIYGHVAKASVGAILRSLLSIEQQGGDHFFGEPALDVHDLFACAPDGRGYVNVLNAMRIMQTPQIYSMFLLYILSYLFETLPEVGDPEKPKFVFFFDEAHLLFDNLPKALIDKIVQIIKLIRSKGVGVYFITQSPSDIPNEVLAQLSNRVQHGLRAYTPQEQKAVRAAAQAFRVNPNFDAAQVLLELGTGEALVSFLDEKGAPCIVENAKVLPPQCLMAAASQEVINSCLEQQMYLNIKYAESIDRVSAYEIIAETALKAAQEAALEEERKRIEEERAKLEAERAKEEEKRLKEIERQAQQARRELEREAERRAREAQKEQERRAREAQKEQERRARERQKEAEQMRKQVLKTAGSIFDQIGKQAGKDILRGIFGTRR